MGTLSSLESFEGVEPKPSFGAHPPVSNSVFKFGQTTAEVKMQLKNHFEALEEEPTLDQVQWAIDQLPDEHVAPIRVATANVPWYGKCSEEGCRKACRKYFEDVDPAGKTFSKSSGGDAGALFFLGGPP